MISKAVKNSALAVFFIGAVLVVVFLGWPDDTRIPESGDEGMVAARAPIALLEFWGRVFARPNAESVQRVVGSDARARDLGKALFFDARLSGRSDRSCASCHVPDLGFSDGRSTGLGADGSELKRNVPTLFDVAWGKSFNWDGSALSLESQALGPILRENEMGGDFKRIVARLSSDAKMSQRFAEAFPERPNVSKETVLSALAAFERSLVSPTTRFDRWVSGESDALSVSEQAGFRVFIGKGGCVACHSGWRFSDDQFHDTGLASAAFDADPGVAGKKGVMAFKTPTLRAVAKTAPYMHDGSVASLMAVVEHYSEGVRVRKGLGALLLRKISLSPTEKAQLVAFLKTL